MIKNNTKKIFDEAVERKKRVQKTSKILVDKKVLDKLRADLDYVAMMGDVELDDIEEVPDNE